MWLEHTLLFFFCAVFPNLLCFVCFVLFFSAPIRFYSTSVVFYSISVVFYFTSMMVYSTSVVFHSTSIVFYLTFVVFYSSCIVFFLFYFCCVFAAFFCLLIFSLLAVLLSPRVYHMSSLKKMVRVHSTTADTTARMMLLLILIIALCVNERDNMWEKYGPRKRYLSLGQSQRWCILQCDHLKACNNLCMLNGCKSTGPAHVPQIITLTFQFS